MQPALLYPDLFGLDRRGEHRWDRYCPLREDWEDHGKARLGLGFASAGSTVCSVAACVRSFESSLCLVVLSRRLAFPVASIALRLLSVWAELATEMRRGSTNGVC